MRQLTESKHPVKRLWLQSMTPQAIRDAFAQLRDERRDARLADAARLPQRERLARRHQRHARDDEAHVRLAAGNVARSAGCRRRRSRSFTSAKWKSAISSRATYWRVTAKFEIAKGEYEGVYQRPDFKKERRRARPRRRIWDQAAAEAIEARLPGQTARDVPKKSKPSSQIAPRLYDLTTLQREANGRFGFSAKRTLQIAQALYERHKMMTYPRTDSRALPEDYFPTVRETLGNLAGELAVACAERRSRTMGPA